MHALEEIRTNQSNVELRFRPVTEMYDLLENYSTSIMDKDEMDIKSDLHQIWDRLVNRGEEIRDQLQRQQADFKKELIDGIKHLIVDVNDFREDFEKNGPMVKGIQPKEALNRLKRFSEEYQVRHRRYESYHAGETLFGLPHQQYPPLDLTRDQIALLEKLYNLYSKVLDTIGKWKEVYWYDIREEIDNMIDQIELFGKECQRLPKDLKKWEAYDELRKEVDDMTLILPLVKELAKPSIRDRHWLEIIDITKKEDLPFAAENFCLNHLLQAGLLEFQDEVEDITDSADKQLKLEKQLREEISAFWEEAELEIKSFGDLDVPAQLSGNIDEIQEKLEEHLMALQQMNAMKYVAPFRSEVQEKLGLFSDISDLIEKWLKVQSLWRSLVTVFKAGDI